MKYKVIIERTYVTELYVKGKTKQEAIYNAYEILDYQELEQCNIEYIEVKSVEQYKIEKI